MPPSHIFIVGASRSGTKFLMNTLNRHSQVNISPETHWFSRLIHRGFIRVAEETGDLQDEKNLKAMLEKMFSGKVFGTFWKAPPVEREAIEKRFLDSDRSWQTLFAELLDQHRQEAGKTIAGEKTPSHVFHVPTLLEWFPQAVVIQMIRDPRAVLASEIHKDAKPDYPLKKKNLLYRLGLLFAISLGWRMAVGKDRRYCRQHGERYFSLRYEDLQNDHEKTVRETCSRLSINFEPAMLNPPRVDSSFAQTQENSNRQSALPRWMSATMQLFLGLRMKQYGY